MARGLRTVTPEAVFYAAACALAERSAVQARFVELFSEDSADPEAVDTLGDRDPGFRLNLDTLDDAAGYVGGLAVLARLEHVWTQVLDQLPSGHRVVPVRGIVR